MWSIRKIRLRSRLEALSDRRGATALEFAILATPIIGILIAALQTSMIFFFNEALQSLTTTVARQIMVGAVQSQGLTQQQFKTMVCAAAQSMPFSCDGLVVDVQSASSFSTLNTQPITITYNGGTPNPGNFSPGTQGSAVIMRIMYDWPVFGVPIGMGFANQSNGTFLLVGTSVFKTEPYQ
jgi:Flp pilus assembly protein TadG